MTVKDLKKRLEFCDDDMMVLHGEFRNANTETNDDFIGYDNIELLVKGNDLYIMPSGSFFGKRTPTKFFFDEE